MKQRRDKMDDKKIKINGVEVSEKELQEKKKDPNIRLHEESPDNYRVLTRLTE